ncbi:MAG: hypothetical protein IJO37_02370 [Ruminiclostridium sp.]|nr:hypothetical protein [Ruminiclostridium sp.]
MGIKVKIDIDPSRVIGDAKRAQEVLANEVLKDTDRYVPADTRSLANSAKVAGGNKIIYPGPYARYLYHGNVMVDAKTGKGPANIPGVGPRFQYGSKLRATDKNLVFSKAVHPEAQSEWFEASKAINLEKWKRVFAKAIRNKK